MSTHNAVPLPRRLKEARLAAKMTQETLGILAGLDEQVASARMSQYENAVHTPDFNFIRKIAKVLKIPTAYFYCEEDELAQVIVSHGKAKQGDMR
ncbi:XRE family transcriptional regulator [Arsukibacterium sp. MJ3]|uniref:helix-turn-helix domain-containing protein n=1 Tax=Arsukibacterium sp. MJ3 TaxID=1632859 RepID=UPI000627092F|nr:helix-turn-helix transcriptional regulator [Arsukibacterium sp. MJ3]KKO47610.1 XRE family transcriptional regulator [Arsukibacterium sp. MJ3]